MTAVVVGVMCCALRYVKTVWVSAGFVVIAGTVGANVNFSGICER
jgi:hypothetical protein